MAPARRVAEPQLRGLQFNEPLNWKPSKSILATTLIERLDTLSKELKDLDQDETDKDSLTKVAKELAWHNLLGHKDRGVRAFTACCLVDILRICVPVAPFSATQLKDIFTFFITSILPPLSDPSNAYNVQHMYVLHSLAEVKSILLITELPRPDPLILQLFKNSFDILYSTSKSSGGEQIGQNVMNDLTDLLVCLVDEIAVLPTEVVEVIIAAFLSPKAISQKKGTTKEDEKQSTLLVQELPAAYHTAKTICEMVHAKMARYISQYFHECMMEVSETDGIKKSNHRKPAKEEDSDDEEIQNGPTALELDSLNKAHQLLREVWRACPDVLDSVIPHLDAELGIENVELRVLAIQTIGDIASGIGAAGPPPPPSMDPSAYPAIMLADAIDSQVRVNPLTMPLSIKSFASAYPGLYNRFVSRHNDKSAVIRAAYTTAIGRILQTSAGGIGLTREDEAQLLKNFAKMMQDSDEKVRMAAVKAVASFDFRDTIAKLAPNGSITTPGSVLGTLADRIRDAKHSIRIEAMTTCAQLWGVAAAEIAAENELVVSALGAIPTLIFETLYINAPDLRVLANRVLFEQLVPLDFPPSKAKAISSNDTHSQNESQVASKNPVDLDKIRTERLLLLIRSLNSKAKKAFFSLQASQAQLSTIMELFLKECEGYNGGVGSEKSVDRKLSIAISYVSRLMPDPPRVSADLWKFAKLHDRRTYALLRFMKNPESDFSTVYKSIKEFRKRIGNEKGAPIGLLETLDPLIYGFSLVVYNRSHLPAIVQFSRSNEKGLGDIAHEILADISLRTPEIFKVHVKELCKLLEEQAPTPSKTNDLDSVKTLKACAGFARKYPKEMPSDRKFIQTLLAFAQYGSPPQAAKYAVSILMQATDRKEMHAKDLFQKVTKDWSYGTDHFLTKLATISQLALLAPNEAREVTDEILDIALQKVLLNVRTEASDENAKWQDDSIVDEECQAKCWALKIQVNTLRATEDEEEVKEISGPVFQMLNLIIKQDGELSRKEETPYAHKARIRLVAAQMLLKLNTLKRYADLFHPRDFIKLALIAQDADEHVRFAFMNKLQKYLTRQSLSNSFYPIAFLSPFEPNKHQLENVTTWIKSRGKYFIEKEQSTLEASFPRLLSLVAHHPDYSSEPDELVDHGRYIMFYITTVVTMQNLGLVYRYAERLKQVRDGIDDSKSENLYVLSELAQSLLRKYAEKKGWAMQAYSGKLKLPAKTFANLPDHAAAQAIADKQYLPDNVENELDRLIRNLDKKKKRKSADDDEKPPAKKAKTEKSKARRDSLVKKTKQPSKPKISKTSKKPTLPESERRRSGRAAIAQEGKSYQDRDSDEDDEEMLDGVAKWEYLSGNPSENNSDEEGSSDTEPDADVEMKDADALEPEADSEVEVEPEPEPKAKSTPAAKAVGKANGKAAVKNTPNSSNKTPRSRAAAKMVSTTPEPETNDDVEAEEDASPSPPAKTNGKGKANKKASQKTPTSTSKLPTRTSRRNAPDPEPAEPEDDADDSPEEEITEPKEATPPPKRNSRTTTKGKSTPKEKEQAKVVESSRSSRAKAKAESEVLTSSQPKGRGKGKAAEKGKGK